METVLTSFSTSTFNIGNQSIRSSLNGNSIPRRSAPFQPPIWEFNYIQSITTEYHQGEPYTSQVMKLKEKVKIVLNSDTTDHLTKLEHIDMLQRLGVSYHFENEIDNILKGFYNNDSCSEILKENLYATALQFRILRQHQYATPKEVFNVFMDEGGSFKQSIVSDVIGMLALYEASFLMLPKDEILDKARDFSTKHLQEFMKKNNGEESNYLSILVDHALDVPLHWRVPRLESRWFFDLYRIKPDYDLTFLDLAILDFNILQSIHLEELKESSRLWVKFGVAEKLDFARNRLVENNLWLTGVTYGPTNGYYRKFATIFQCLITLMDDTYDTYGTLDELKLFTNAIESWSLNAMDPLPDYMKLCFLAIYNHTNELAYDVLKQQGLHLIKYLKYWLADICRAYFEEAKWYHSKKTPSLQEYIENGWLSIANPAIIGFTYLCVANPIMKDELEALENYSSPIVRQSSLICRLINDLSTSSFELEKGDSQKSIQCYMHETGATEEEARNHIKLLVRKTWELMNKEWSDQNCPFSRAFREIIINTARAFNWFYHKRDGFGYENNIQTKDWADLIFAKSITFRSIVE